MPDTRLDDPDLPLGDLMRRWPQTIRVFAQHNMLCPGCMVSPFHTVTDACEEYGLNEEIFRQELGAAVSSSAGLPA